MGTRWRQTPDGVRRVAESPGRAASVAGAVLAITGTAFALLITGAMLLPVDAGTDDPAIAAGASPTASAVATGIGSIASPAPMRSPTPGTSPEVPPSAAPARPDPTNVPGSAPSVLPTEEPLRVAFRSAAPVTRDGREIGSVTVQAVLQAKKTTAVGDGQRLMVAEVRFDARRARLPYDELHFRLEDDNGQRYEPIAEGAPEPLGAGDLAPSAKVTGQVAFVVPKERKAVAVVLTDAGGADLVVFSRPQAAR